MNSNTISQALSAIKTGKFWKELIIMIIGMMITAAAIYYFLVPSKLIIGTISGLSIVLTEIFGQFGIHVKLSLVIVIINLILLVLAYILIDHEFGIKTVFTALILGPMTDLWELIYPYTKFLTEPGQTSVMNDPWLDLCCFVLLLSASQATLFSINASTGGLDILAKIVNKYLHLDIGVSVSVAGAVICCTAFAINPFRMVVIGLIGTWINGLVVDYFTASLSKRKKVSIISDDAERIREFIIRKLVRGCTLHPCKGGFSGNERVEIQVILTQDEFAGLMAFIREEQIDAFITAGNLSEVYGTWFRHYKRNHPEQFEERNNLR